MAKQKIFTVKELKALLQGMDILHGTKSWSPDKDQWERIRSKIDSLSEGSEIYSAVEPPQYQQAPPLARQMLIEPAPAIAAEKTPEELNLERIRSQLRANMRMSTPAPAAGAPIISPMANGTNAVLPPATGPSEFQ